MGLRRVDNVGMLVSGTPGTGNITLGAAIDASYQTFANSGQIANGDQVVVRIDDGADWELSTVTYSTTGPSLTTRTLIKSSTGSLLSLTSAAKVVAVLDAANAGLRLLRVVEITATGSYTPSSDAVFIDGEIISGGSGGAGGGKGTTGGGGASGSGGFVTSMPLTPVALLNTPCPVSIGAGGTGGVGAGTATGGTGAAGGTTSIQLRTNTYMAARSTAVANAGTGSAGGTAAAAATFNQGMYTNSRGVAGGLTATGANGGSADTAYWGPGGGGSGGGVSGAIRNGGLGGAFGRAYFHSVAPGGVAAAGVGDGASGAAGAAAADVWSYGNGGGGGAGSDTGVGGAGGAGGFPGGGGGGGGATRTGSTAGAGGNGASGAIRIREWG